MLSKLQSSSSKHQKNIISFDFVVFWVKSIVEMVCVVNVCNVHHQGLLSAAEPV